MSASLTHNRRTTLREAHGTHAQIAQQLRARVRTLSGYLRDDRRDVVEQASLCVMDVSDKEGGPQTYV